MSKATRSTSRAKVVLDRHQVVAVVAGETYGAGRRSSRQGTRFFGGAITVLVKGHQAIAHSGGRWFPCYTLAYSEARAFAQRAERLAHMVELP